jgi:hypothetical protein
LPHVTVRLSAPDRASQNLTVPSSHAPASSFHFPQ